MAIPARMSWQTAPGRDSSYALPNYTGLKQSNELSDTYATMPQLIRRPAQIQPAHKHVKKKTTYLSKLSPRERNEISFARSTPGIGLPLQKLAPASVINSPA